MVKFKFELGEEVKDVITGYSGIVMAQYRYLTGCNQYGIGLCKLTQEGKRPDWEQFDENRLVSSGKVFSLTNGKFAQVKETDKGFDGPLNSIRK